MAISFVYPEYLWFLLLIPVMVLLAFWGSHSMKILRHRVGTIMRIVILAAIVLALSGMQVHVPDDTLTVVFLMDVSDSMTPAAQDDGEELIQESMRQMAKGDSAAIIVFGKNALVERLASEESRFAELTSAPVTTRTDIGSALQLAMALFPNEGAKRLVLLSDGRENLGKAIEQAEIAAVQDIEMLYYSLGQDSVAGEVRLESLDTPEDIREGEKFNLTAQIESTSEIDAELYVFEDENLLEKRDLKLKQGTNTYQIAVTGEEVGFKRYRAQVIPATDRFLQNNEASAFTIIHGPAQVLVVEGKEGEADNLVSALEAAELRIEKMLPGRMPTQLTDLSRYDAVVLVNVPLIDLPKQSAELLPVYVRDLGKGLVMVGGETSFGAGGYLRTPIEEALPVNMDVKSKEREANLALILAVDKSGSMGRCHCDNPDLNQTYTPSETGQPKVDIAKEAIMRSASALGESDYLGVLAFDSEAYWAVKPSLLVDSYTLETAIGGMQAYGSTNMAVGVQAAYEALADVDARFKHIILLTDGWEQEGNLSGLVSQKYAEGITFSVVAAGEGSAQYLASLSQLGGGRYYPATDMLNVPDVFLKETVKSVGEYIIEEPFYPIPAGYSPILESIDETRLPPLRGYNGASAKNTARINLMTPRGDPLLASWQYGLGRSVAWTSDLKGQWADQWVQSDFFPRFVSQLVGWVLPLPQAEGMDVQTFIEKDELVVRLQANAEDGALMNDIQVTATVVDPDMQAFEMALKLVGSGQYQASLNVDKPGTYLVRVGASEQDLPLGQTMLGVVVPYSPEYRSGQNQQGILSELAGVTGGGLLSDPAMAFEHNLPKVALTREIWQILLWIAALLFPLDIALRRFVISSRDLQMAKAWVGEHLRFKRNIEKTSVPRVLGNLFDARERVRQRQKPAEEDFISAPATAFTPETPGKQAPAQAVQQDAKASVDSLERLRAAKQRARRKQ